ncbi:hypothetical protein [Methylicorpusculum oleiharenae]|nr:hypothetical protein [Methylicorpusculum oleiharenae]
MTGEFGHLNLNIQFRSFIMAKPYIRLGKGNAADLLVDHMPLCES